MITLQGGGFLLRVLRTFYINLIKETDVGFDGGGDFRDADEFVSTVGTGGFARTQLQRGEGHEGLVAQRGRTERFQTHRLTAAHDGVLRVDAGGMKTEGAGGDLTLQTLLQELKDKLVLIEFVGAYINDHLTTVGHYIVLGAGMNHGNIHDGGAQKVAHLAELMGVEEMKVFESFINGIDTFTTGSMA